jgi:tetratricopeptide (TPR) repeat protein
MRSVLVVLALLLASWPSPGLAQEAPPADEARAKELYANGQRLYDEGYYEQAIAAWKEAYALSSRPALLYNVSNAYERLGKLQEALDTLNLYRAFASGDEAATLDRRIAVLERRLAEQRAAPLPPAPVVASPSLVPDATPPAVTRRARPGVAAVGGGTTLLFGVVAAATYASSRAWIEEGDRERYERFRPINNAALGLAGASLAVTGIGLAPVWTDGGPAFVGTARF